MRTVHALGDGAIRDWLVSPAWRSPCDDLAALLAATGPPWGDDGRWVLTQGPEVAPLKGRLYRRRPLVLDQALPEIAEGGPVRWVAPGGARADSGTWRRVHTQADGVVDWSEFCFLPEYRHAVAGACLEVDQPEWRTIEIASTGPCAVWLSGSLLGVFDDVSYMEPVPHAVRVRLGSGVTPLLIATWQAGFREVRHIVRVAVQGLPVRVVIPSPGADELASAMAESVLDSIAVDSWALPGTQARLSGPAGVALRVTRDDGVAQTVVLAEGRAVLPVAGDGHGDGSASMLSTGETTLSIRVDDDRCPVSRDLSVAVLPSRVRHRPEGDDPAVWRREVLAHTAGSEPSVARALAGLSLGAGSPGGGSPGAGSLAAGSLGGGLAPDDLRQALSMLRDRADCADFEAVGLLSLWRAAPADAWPDGTREEVRQALLGFKYWIDQPGLDAMCYFTENHQLVFHTAELLALVTLVELAADARVRAAAEALLDKLLFTLAANSWHGIHGAAHGRSYAQTLRSSRFEETAPIMWALWGTGALNRAVLPATCLARARRYSVPALVRSVAAAGEFPWYGRQVYRGQHQFTRDLLSRPYGSDLRVWKTPHAMLSSVQDYRAGLPGLQEHVWGATLAPEVQVFATYPGSASDSPSARPNA
jgi:hypothetical protein